MSAALQLVGRWIFSFGYFFFCRIGERMKAVKGRERGSQLNPPCHTVPLCHSRYQFSEAPTPSRYRLPLTTPLSQNSSSSLAVWFDVTIRGFFSYRWTSFVFFFLVFFPPRISRFSLFSTPRPLGRGLSVSEQTASLCSLRAIRAQTKRLISLKPGYDIYSLGRRWELEGGGGCELLLLTMESRRESSEEGQAEGQSVETRDGQYWDEVAQRRGEKPLRLNWE